MKKKLMTGLGLVLVMFTLILAGCAGGNSDEAGLADISTAESETLSDSGILVLRINPELAIEYDENGKVTSVTGRNDDGREIVDAYADYIGKDSGLVLEELIDLISEAGYFVEEVEGKPQQIVIELESGSILPEDDFLEKMTTNVQGAVSKLNVDSNVVSDEDLISLEEAKQIALDHAKVNSDKAKFDDKELDEDDGNFIYELEFYADGYEFEYDVHAVTGEIIKSERDHEQKSARKGQSQEAKLAKQKTQKSEHIGMERAKQIAFNHAGINGAKARFDDQEFDVDDGVPSYELEFDIGPNEYEYEIHAVSGNIIDYEHDLEEAKQSTAKKPAEQKTAPEKPKQLSRDEAINIALKHAGLNRSQVEFDDVELDWDDGRLEWEIEFDSGNWEFEYEIDGHSGQILDYDKEYDD